MDVLGIGLAIWLVFAIIPIGLALWALVDLAGKTMDSTTKILWALLIVFFPFVGSIASLIVNNGRGRAAT